MKKEQWLMVGLLVVLLGAGFFVASNCGGGQLINTTNVTSDKGWQTVGDAEFSYGKVMTTGISLFVYQGTPYVAYNQTSFASDSPVVQKFSGTSWESVGEFPVIIPSASNVNMIAGDSSLFIDGGTPYVACFLPVAYSAGNKGGTVVSVEGTVMKFNGATWETVGLPGFSAGVNPTKDISLFVYNGTPFVAFMDGSISASNKATVMKYNGSDWEIIGPAGFCSFWTMPPTMTHYFSLYIYNGTSYLAFGDADYGNKASVMKYNGSSWEYVGTPGFSSGEAGYVSICVDNGVPYVSYSDVGTITDSRGITKESSIISAMRFDGSNWIALGDLGNRITGSNPNHGALAVYNGQPFIAFDDQDIPALGAASLMSYNGSSWNYIGARAFTFGHAAMYNSLFIYNGIPYVAYRDGVSGKLTVMRYFE